MIKKSEYIIAKRNKSLDEHYKKLQKKNGVILVILIELY